MIFPTRELIIRQNYELIKATKGFFKPPNNLLNPASLDWVLDTIRHPIYNEYPSIEEKASLLCWTIIVDHVFYDGNKRTGMFSLESFLTINGIFLEASPDDVVEIALSVAKSKNRYDSKQTLITWVKQHTTD